MKEVSISGSIRENVGKRDAKKIRSIGNVPCVLYGGKEQLHFHISEKSFKDLVYTPEIAFVNLDLEGKSAKAILKDVQFHVVTGNILHADFQELVESKELSMNIPIKLVGNSKGVKEGGVVQNNMRNLLIKALPKDMPENIEIDITNLGVGDSVKVGDLNIENCTLLDLDVSVIVAVNITRVSSGAAEESLLDDDETADSTEEVAEATEGDKEAESDSNNEETKSEE